MYKRQASADISVSAANEFQYKSWSDSTTSTTNDTSMTNKQTYTISASAVLDNGMSISSYLGTDGSDNFGDSGFSISGDFGTIGFAAQGNDPGFVHGFDETADLAGEGSAGTQFNLAGAAGESVGYKLPSIVDGLTLAVEHSNEDTTESFGYGISYNAGIATVGYAKVATNTTDYTAVNIAGSVSGIGFGVEKTEISNGTSIDEATKMGVSYTMDAITLAYEAGSAEDEGGDLDDYSQLALSYAVAPGITTVLTSSEVNQVDTTDGAADVESMEIQLKLSF